MDKFEPDRYFGECEFYFRRPENWGREINFYAYNANHHNELSNWPGEKMLVYDYDADEDVYYGTFYCEYFDLGGTRVMFSDGKNQAPGPFEEGFLIKKRGLYTQNGLDSICHYKEVAPGKYIKTLVCDKV